MSEEELRDRSKTEAKAEHINAATTLWSPHWERWVQERGAAASKAKKAVLRNGHILAFGEVKNRTHILKLFQRMLWHPSHFTNSWPTVPKAHGTPTHSSNAHMLFQRSLRCALQHIPVTMLLLDFCHQIQHCTSDYIHWRNMEIVGGMQATEQSSSMFISTPALVSCSYLSQREMI